MKHKYGIFMNNQECENMTLTHAREFYARLEEA